MLSDNLLLKLPQLGTGGDFTATRGGDEIAFHLVATGYSGRRRMTKAWLSGERNADVE
jgi:hypothetical protein